MRELIEKFKIYGFKTFSLFVFGELKNKLIMQGMKGSYSQKGEDLELDKLLKGKKIGFYVDVGAYDPHRFSNTKRFYLRGWNGINIEPDPINYKKFLDDRPRDINLQIGVGSSDKKLKFYRFIPDTLSTFSKSEADNYVTQGYKLVEKLNIEVKKLSDIFAKHANKKTIDFMSVDTEGFDFEVLKTNNWKKYAPKYLCVESFTHHMHGGEKHEYDHIREYLEEQGYKRVYENGLNCIYKYTGK